MPDDAHTTRKGRHRPGIVSAGAGIGDLVPSQFFFRGREGHSFLIVQPG